MDLSCQSPKKILLNIKKLAKTFGKVCKKYGAIEYFECVADDVKKGKITSFPRSVKLKAGETVIFSWIIYKSKAQRNTANKKIMQDPLMKKAMDSMKIPFDDKRMFMGGFKPLIMQTK